MASNTLFPPVVNNTEPAFITYPSLVQETEELKKELRIYFKFSALNSDLDHKDEISVHATVHLKKSGSSVVTTVDGETLGDGTFSDSRRLRATQIILNLKPEQVENTNYWYVTLKNSDIYQSGTFNQKRYDGWQPGSIYKIQIRLSEVKCVNENPNSSIEENQQKWLYDNADRFSEWSTVIYSKCLSDYNIHNLDKYIFEETLPTYDTGQMPEPSETLALKNETVKYIGDTTVNYTKGYIYTCTKVFDSQQEEYVYVWEHRIMNLYPQTFQGRIEFVDMDVNREHYDSCLLRLYESDANKIKGNLIEEATIYPSEISMDNYNYTIKYDFKPSNDNEKFYYLIEFSFITQNKYQSQILTNWFIYPENAVNICNYELVTVDTVNTPLVEKIKEEDGYKCRYFTSLGKENDNACVGLKIKYDPVSTVSFHWEPVNLRIVRSSEDTNFTIWEVIKYINLNFETAPTTRAELDEYLENMDIFYDYSVESNTFYRYGIQSLTEYYPEELWTAIKKLTKVVPNPDYSPEADPSVPESIKIITQIQRDFEYSYLLGKNQQQLKIKFNDNINNFIPQVYDNKIEPVGSQFPYIYRNSKANYRTFPISGTISFEMDDNNTFLINGELDIYNGYEEVKELHKNDWVFGKYNYGYERRFRQKVINYLTDGTFKLYKSATEGNILVRLKDVNLTPNQQLSRLIYNFSANIDEVDINSLDNLKKYGIIYPGTYVTDLSSIHIDPPISNKDIDPPHSHGVMTSTPTNIPPARKNKGGQ